MWQKLSTMSEKRIEQSEIKIEKKFWLEPGESLPVPKFPDLKQGLIELIKGNIKDENLVFFDRGGCQSSELPIFNRIFLYEYAKYLRDEGRKNLLMMLFDLDHLKAYNTFFGDPEGGDEAVAEFISAFSGAAKEIFGETGGYWLVRRDGDTFGLLLSEEKRELGEKFGKKVGERLQTSDWELEEGTKKFRRLSPGDKNLLRNLLFPAKVTFSSLKFLSVSSDKEFDKGLKGLNEEIREKKEKKITPELRRLMERLG